MPPFSADPTYPYPTPSVCGTNQPIIPTNSPPASGCIHAVFRGSRINFARIHVNNFVNATDISPPSTPSSAYIKNSHGLTS